MSWYSVAALVDLALPGLPSTKRGVQVFAKTERWAERCSASGEPLARPRAGRGGGIEFHESLLPAVARARLLEAREQEEQPTPAAANRGAATEAWARYDRLKAKAKETANRRALILDDVAALERGGSTRSFAVAHVARTQKVGASTLHGWMRLVEGWPRQDWPAALAPRHAGRTATAEFSVEAWDMLVSLYLRSNEPSFQRCYDRVERAAKEHGWTVPPAKTAKRRLDREIPRATQILARKGEKAFDETRPAQRRDRSVFRALEAVNADGHLVDLFVQWPDEDKPRRPTLVGFQDIYSGKILSWRVDKTENEDVVRLAFGDLVEKWGVPEHVWVDNGMAFAGKRMTGQSERRFRFKRHEDLEAEPLGIFRLLGTKVHFVTPGHGQAKPIERAWGDIANTVSKHPAFVGAYAGNSPVNTPFDRGSRAIPLAEFLKVMADEIVLHNARQGRRSPTCNGRSFDETFAESYSAAPVRKVTAEQQRLFLLASDLVSADRKSGAIRLHGNVYWSEDLVEHAGRKVVIRFDPQALHQPAYVYNPDGDFICEAPCEAPVGFNDTAAARELAAAKRSRRKAAKAYLDASRRMGLDDAVSRLPKVELPDDVDPAVIRPTFGPTPPRAKRSLAEAPDTGFMDGVSDNVTTLEIADNRRRRRV